MPRFVYNTYGILCKFYPRETFLGLKLQGGYVGNILYVPLRSAVLPDKVRSSHGAHVLYYLGEFDNIGRLVLNLGTGTEPPEEK